MRPSRLLPLLVLLGASGAAPPARADSITATCILSRHDHTLPREKGPCMFSQRQGNATVRLGRWAFDFPAAEQGRSFERSEEISGTAVCILGQTVRATLFGAGDTIGATVRVRGLSCEVIGVLTARGAGSFGQDQDDLLLIPIKTMQRRLKGDNEMGSMSVALLKSVDSATGIRTVQALMRDRRQIEIGEGDNFSVTDMRDFNMLLSGVNSVMAGLLSAVAAVSQPQLRPMTSWMMSIRGLALCSATTR